MKYKTSTKEAFKKLNLLRLPELYKFSVLLFVYKYKNNLLPQTFQNFYQTNSQVHQYPTRNAGRFREPMAKLRITAAFIKKAGVSLWNEYASQISHETKISLFKKTITVILSQKYE
jgi:hypothetical protein